MQRTLNGLMEFIAFEANLFLHKSVFFSQMIYKKEKKKRFVLIMNTAPDAA